MERDCAENFEEKNSSCCTQRII